MNEWTRSRRHIFLNCFWSKTARRLRESNTTTSLPSTRSLLDFLPPSIDVWPQNAQVILRLVGIRRPLTVRQPFITQAHTLRVSVPSGRLTATQNWWALDAASLVEPPVRIIRVSSIVLTETSSALTFDGTRRLIVVVRRDSSCREIGRLTSELPSYSRHIISLERCLMKRVFPSSIVHDSVCGSVFSANWSRWIGSPSSNTLRMCSSVLIETVMLSGFLSFRSSRNLIPYFAESRYFSAEPRFDVSFMCIPPDGSPKKKCVAWGEFWRQIIVRLRSRRSSVSSCRTRTGLAPEGEM